MMNEYEDSILPTVLNYENDLPYEVSSLNSELLNYTNAKESIMEGHKSSSTN